MNRMGSPIVGQQFPDFEIDDFSVKHFKSVGPILIVVWRADCPTCQLLLPFIDRMAAHYPGATVVGIAQNTAEELKEVVDTKKLKMKNYADPHLRITKFLGVDVVPVYWLVGRSGKTLIRGAAWDRGKVLTTAQTLAQEASALYVPLFTSEDQVPSSKPG
jgi:thiol-disulfide isomerase/thioredoxin